MPTKRFYDYIVWRSNYILQKKLSGDLLDFEKDVKVKTIVTMFKEAPSVTRPPSTGSGLALDKKLNLAPTYEDTEALDYDTLTAKLNKAAITV